MEKNKIDLILLFTDAATSSKMNIAVGAFLCLDQKLMQNYAECSIKDLYIKLADRIVYQKYVSKKSTWAEIKIVVDALNFLHKNGESIQKVEIYSDCQSLCDLLGKRKEMILQNNFRTRTGKILENAILYKELFKSAEQFQIQTFKIKGHCQISNRLTLQEKIFAVLDRFSRKKLRSLLI
jgi:ribonuclease HI